MSLLDYNYADTSCEDDRNPRNPILHPGPVPQMWPQASRGFTLEGWGFVWLYPRGKVQLAHLTDIHLGKRKWKTKFFHIYNCQGTQVVGPSQGSNKNDNPNITVVALTILIAGYMIAIILPHQCFIFHVINGVQHHSNIRDISVRSNIYCAFKGCKPECKLYFC